MLDGARRAKLEHPASVPHSSNGMKKTKFLYPRPFRCFHNPRHRSHGNLVRTGYQGGRRCRAGRVAETRLEIFIRGPGPFRGSPAPAKATAGAPTIGQDHRRGAGKAPYIYFTRCRPSAPLPDYLNGQTGNGAWQRRNMYPLPRHRFPHGVAGECRAQPGARAGQAIKPSAKAIVFAFNAKPIMKPPFPGRDRSMP